MIDPGGLCGSVLIGGNSVVVFGAEISRIPPKGYTYIFIACDFISLCLQGKSLPFHPTNINTNTY